MRHFIAWLKWRARRPHPGRYWGSLKWDEWAFRSDLYWWEAAKPRRCK